MKVSVLSVLGVALLGALSHVAAVESERDLAADAEVELELDEMELEEDERELGMTKAQKKALRLKKKAARKAKRAAKRAAKKKKQQSGGNYYHPKPATTPHPTTTTTTTTPYEPPIEMYKELIYMEKACGEYDEVLIRDNGSGVDNEGNDYQIGDSRSFSCELYEASIKFGQFGGEYLGNTYWTCIVFALRDYEDDDEFGEVIWDCTVTDYIGEATDTKTYLRTEGITLGVDEPDLERINSGDDIWDEYHSHTGTFAVAGGVGLAKGARGQMEVEWDDYKMTWFHVYTVEVWKLEQTPILPYH